MFFGLRTSMATAAAFALLLAGVVAAIALLVVAPHLVEGVVEGASDLDEYISIIGAFASTFILTLAAPYIQAQLEQRARIREYRKTMNVYAGPLLLAAQDLSDLIYGITDGASNEEEDKGWAMVFKDRGPEDQYYFIASTMFVLARYFACVEILNSKLQFSIDRRGREMVQLEQAIHAVRVKFANDVIAVPDVCKKTLQQKFDDTASTDHRKFQLYRQEQHAIASCVIKHNVANEPSCMDFQDFLDLLQKKGYKTTDSLSFREKGPKAEQKGTYDVVHKLRTLVCNLVSSSELTGRISARSGLEAMASQRAAV
jgi:hypothetical protein